jgi:hypothetical protein
MQSKQRRSRRWLIGVISVSFVVLLSLAFHKGRDIVAMTGKSTDGKSARIVGYRDGPFEDYAGDLVLYAADGKLVLRTNLVGGRDSIEDIPAEFLPLEIDGDAVHLQAEGWHHHGTNEFKFPK